MAASDGSPSGSPGDVGRLLAPLQSAYVRRSGSPPVLTQADAAVTEPGLHQCLVEAIVTIDEQGRIPWRWAPGSAERRGVAVSLGADGESIELRFEHSRPDRRCPDRQGRLQLPRRLLRVVSMPPGSRAAIVRFPSGRGLVLVSSARLGVRERPRAG